MNKTCTNCGESKPLEAFYRSKSRASGYTSDCKPCVNARNRQWAQDNPEKRKAIANGYTARNREALRVKGRENYANNPEARAKKHAREKERRQLPEVIERRRESRATWKEINADRIKEQNRVWRANNRDRRRATRLKWRAENPERTNELTRQWYYANLEYFKIKNREFKQSRPELSRLYANRRRAMKQNAHGKTTQAQIQARIDYFGRSCWMCGKPYEQIDHVKPLSKGGSNWASNLRPICKRCNSSKGSKWPFASVQSAPCRVPGIQL